MPTVIQPSFSKGEIAPSLHGRVDTQAYQVGLRTAKNTLVHAYGGISNRPGLQFLAPVKDHDYAPSFIEFQFKTTDTYMLEFGDLYMRVYRNDVLLTEANKTITGATAANPVVITSASHGYTTGDQVYISGVVGMTELNGRWFTVGTTATNTFELKSQTSGSNINGTAYTAYSSGGTAAKVYEITTPYDIDDVPLIKYTQSADVMTLTHNLYPVYELSRTGHISWALAQPTFAPTQSYPTALTVTVGSAGAATYNYKVTAVGETTFEESLAGVNNASLTITGITQANPAVVTSAAHGLSNGDEVYISGVVGMTQVNGKRFIAAGVAANTFQLSGINSTTYTAYGSAGTAKRTFVIAASSSTTTNNTLTWTAVSGAQRYSVYKQSNGLYGLIGETENTTFIDANLGADLDVAPPRSRNPFESAGDYPGTASYYEQRRVFGGSVDRPDTSEYSQTGNQSNFSVSSPSRADDAITATFSARQVNEIRHYIPGNDLIVLTSGSEWKASSGNDSAFSATTIKQKPQSYWGSSHLRPITAGTTILYVPDDKARVRNLGYSLQADSYVGTEMTTLANHFFERYSITDWAYARAPIPVVFMVRSDGLLATMTFQAEQEVNGWTLWRTKGKFETVGVIPSSDTSTERDDRAYFVVKRRINGETVRYVERLHSRQFDDVQDCFFVDSGLSLNSPVTITGVTAANPVVITAASHGFSNGDEVDISDIEWESDFDEVDTESQPDQLNMYRYTAANVTANTFELEDEDGDPIDGTAFNAYVGGGYARKAVLTVSGLWHLEGQGVAVLSNGDVVNDLTVANGLLTLPRKSSRVHVGLRYTSDVETLNIETPQGTIQGKLKRVVSATIRFYKSRGLWIGPDADNLTEMKQREFEDYNEPTNLLTGDKTIIIESGWDSNGRVFMRQRDPLPMTILAVVPNFQVGDQEVREDMT